LILLGWLLGLVFWKKCIHMQGKFSYV
jgi:hypothetical protein